MSYVSMTIHFVVVKFHVEVEAFIPSLAVNPTFKEGCLFVSFILFWHVRSPKS
jgi:hypothetical protein